MKLATFDIWDTCLTRSFSEPKHVFHEVARRILAVERFENPETAELARMRVMAEQKAREAVPGGECRLDEIADALTDLAGEGLGNQFTEVEMAVEREAVRPVVPVRRLLEACRAKGETIAFISDMYLPSEFLRDLLHVHGFCNPEDAIFVSGEHRANKSSGKLYEIVRKTYAINPAFWTHWGDKAHADVKIPRRIGIQAIHSRGTQFTKSEIRAAEACANQARSASRLKGGMRVARLSGDQSCVFSDVVAPWLCALAARMVRLAREMGLRRLYFLSRDGEILFRIAKRIAPPNLECHYLYSSRRAWCFPAMLTDDAASRRWLETFAVSPRGILRSLEFSKEESESILQELKITPVEAERRAPPKERVFVWEHLRATGRMETVLERAATARNACLAYLEQEGLFEDDLWAICDVGWVLNGQAALTRLLRTRQPSAAARGFYFMVNRRRPPLVETGPFSSWLLDEALPTGPRSIPETVTWLSGLIEEVFFSNSSPSLQGYRLDEATGQAEPVFGIRQDDGCAIGHAKELREAVDQLTNEWQDELRDPNFVELLSQYSLTEVLRFLRTPSREEALVIARLHHSSEATNAKEDAGCLARAWQVGDALQVLGRRSRLLDPQSVKEPLWTAGCDALTHPVNRWIRKLVLTPLRRQD
jgi:FMN phosphatase YigB (HAD superfamily)